MSGRHTLHVLLRWVAVAPIIRRNPFLESARLGQGVTMGQMAYTYGPNDLCQLTSSPKSRAA